MRNLYILLLLLLTGTAFPQVVINEGSNRNYLQFPDEDGEYPDWIELYNKGNQTVNLYNYSLTDNNENPTKWVLPNISLAAHEYKTIFCSGKDRKPASAFVQVKTDYNYTPQIGWNNHQFSTSFYWDGISNILINTCSYSSAGYTSNSVFKQSATSYYSTSFVAQDGSESACSSEYGTRVKQRPNIKLNGYTIGSGNIQNSNTGYPAPYGNWYWAARHQILIRANELTAAGMTAGNINSLSFNVVSTDPNTVYTYFDIYMRLVTMDELEGVFMPVNLNNYLHTNFKISQHGESVYLYSPTQNLVGELFVHSEDLDNSTGVKPDGSFNTVLFSQGTPGASNNASQGFTEYLLAPEFSMPSGIYPGPVTVTISNPNVGGSSIHYTTDGSEPTITSATYSGPLQILYPTVLKARAFSWSKLPSQNKTASFLFNISHTTPIISVITDPVNLYGELGIFDNWWTDWERAAYVDYFDKSQKLIFSQRTGMQIDGGWGGSRFQPQHSFRLEPGDGVLGDSAVHYALLPQKPERTKFSKIYLRNGSNQYLTIPYKEGCQAEIASSNTNSYYSAMTPVSVYINGYYFGLYELREKLDEEFFHVYDSADVDQMDLLTLSAWYSFVLRAQVGSVDHFVDDYNSFLQLNPSDTSYWTQAEQYFDINNYTDYIIAESWMANTDWPGNNIKIYRSDKTDFKWKFIPVDFELGLSPNSWTDCYFDHIAYMLGQDPGNMYINIWLRSIQNQKFKNYFINRFADIMNSAYKYDTVSAIENRFFTEFATEMPKEYARWGDINNIPGQMDNFVNNHNILTSQFELRNAEVRNHIQTSFDLPNQLNVTLEVYPPGGGKIHISTL
ncbi:MAG: CotH kinase family protein, partial [Chloroflexota bacterium]